MNPMEKPNPKVSVSLITYNHADFVAQAVESVLMQETEFEYELVIGEDDSSDGTRKIVKSYKEEYPDKIRLLLNERENVIYIDGRPTGRWNMVNALQHCNGQYVTLLEGDDYWTSPDKLQVQVDFLDNHADCAICFHAVEQLTEEGKTRSSGQGLTKSIYTIEDLLERNFIPNCSVMFRNGLVKGFPGWYFEVPMGDWPLHVLNAQYGDIGYIDRVMAVYRIHPGGIRSSKSSLHKVRTNLVTLEKFRQHLDSQYRSTLDDSIAQRHLAIIQILIREGHYKAASLYASNLPADAEVSKRSLAKAVLDRLVRRIGVPT